jgi:predicted lactoylglutathione lyase
MQFLVNVDVDDLNKATRFYEALTASRCGK